jgi:uncharacterized protein (DUF1501 family)
MPLTRRTLLGGLGAASAALAVGRPRLLHAATPGDRRLVLLVLRGGLDGLALVPPHGDGHHAAARGDAAIPAPGRGQGAALDLDGFFGLHPAMAPVHGWWAEGQLGFVHAVGQAAGKRSHFDAQDLLEGGGARPGGVRDGWLNRALAAGGRQEAAAIGGALPLVLRGDHPVTSLDPARDPQADPSFIDRVATLYAVDPVLGPALRRARAAQDPSDAMADGKPRMKAKRKSGLPLDTVRATGELLARPDGPRVATLDVGGWDTHAQQSRRLSGMLGGLAAALVALRESMGPTWEHTLVVAVTEFGRTVRANGTGGTDHGTASAVLLAGGGAAGGEVHGAWPGLGREALHEGRDLAATTPMRGLLAGICRDWLGVPEAALGDTVFPGLAGTPPVGGLVRRA